MTEETEPSSETIQLFTLNLSGGIAGQQTFIFDIHLKVANQAFEYRLCELSLKQNLWEACLKELYWPDITFTVGNGDVKFKAHKAILAARSQVFDSHFKQTPASTSIRLDGVDATCVEQFLKFLYTGVVESGLVSKNQTKKLLNLAVKFQVPALEKYCRAALRGVDICELAKVTAKIGCSNEILPIEVVSEYPCSCKEDSDYAVYRFDWRVASVPSNGNVSLSNVLSYGKLPLCVAVLMPREQNCVEASDSDYEYGYSYSSGNTLSALVTLTPLLSYTIKEAHYSLLDDNNLPTNWGRFTSRKQGKEDVDCNTLWAKIVSPRAKNSAHLRFQLNIAKKAKSYNYSMMDIDWSKNMLDSCFGPYADVEIMCGTKKFFAHRVVLSSRSSVLYAKFNTEKSGKTKICIENVEPATVLHFLKFLYTGFLPELAFDEREQLEELAKTYEISSLIECVSSMSFNRSVDDILLSVIA